MGGWVQVNSEIKAISAQLELGLELRMAISTQINPIMLHSGYIFIQCHTMSLVAALALCKLSSGEILTCFLKKISDISMRILEISEEYYIVFGG